MNAHDVPEIHDPLVLFDGVCNLCSASVQFIVRHDLAAQFRFAAIQSEIGRETFRSKGLDPMDFQTVVLVADGKVFVRSDAAIEIVSRLGGAWRLLSLLRFVPKVLRDSIYSFIARNRYRLFGRKEVCMVPTAEIKERFLN